MTDQSPPPLQTGPGNFMPLDRRQCGITFLLATSLSLAQLRAGWQLGVVSDRAVAEIAVTAAKQLMEFAAITVRESRIGEFNAELDQNLSAVLDNQDHKGL